MVKTTDLQVIIDHYSESASGTENVTGKKFIYSCKFIECGFEPFLLETVECMFHQ